MNLTVKNFENQPVSARVIDKIVQFINSNIVHIV